MDASPVPAPEGLLAQGWIRDADAIWSRAQRGIGGAFALLPSTEGGLACALSGLDGSFGALIDGRSIAYAVMAVGEPGTGPAWAIALPLIDGGRTAHRLLDSDAGHVAVLPAAGPQATGEVRGGRVHDAGELRILDHHPGVLSLGVGVAGRWLVIARDEAALTSLGPYATRTMPALPAPDSRAPIVFVSPQSALSGPVTHQLNTRWAAVRGWALAQDEQARARHGGRPPDYGEPRGVVDALEGWVSRRIEVVSEAQSMRMELDAGDDDLHLDLWLVPRAGPAGRAVDAGAQDARAWLEAMHPGDARPLLAVPASAALAVLVRQDATTRAADDAELATAMGRVLGSRLKDDDVRAVGAAIDGWSHGRGDWMTVALSWNAASQGVWLRTPSGDAVAARRAVLDLIDLARRPALAGPLEGSLHLLPPTIATVDVPEVGRATLATFATAHEGVGPGGLQGTPRVRSDGGGAEATAPPISVAWAAHDGSLLVAAGHDARQLLSGEASPAASLGDDPRSASALSSLGADVTFAAIAQPLRLDPALGGQRPAPTVVAWGSNRGALWVRVGLSDVLLREAARVGVGL